MKKNSMDFDQILEKCEKDSEQLKKNYKKSLEECELELKKYNDKYEYKYKTEKEYKASLEYELIHFTQYAKVIGNFYDERDELLNGAATLVEKPHVIYGVVFEEDEAVCKEDDYLVVYDSEDIKVKKKQMIRDFFEKVIPHGMLDLSKKLRTYRASILIKIGEKFKDKNLRIVENEEEAKQLILKLGLCKQFAPPDDQSDWNSVANKIVENFLSQNKNEEEVIEILTDEDIEKKEKIYGSSNKSHLLSAGLLACIPFIVCCLCCYVCSQPTPTIEEIREKRKIYDSDNTEGSRQLSLSDHFAIRFFGWIACFFYNEDFKNPTSEGMGVQPKRFQFHSEKNLMAINEKVRNTTKSYYLLLKKSEEISKQLFYSNLNQQNNLTTFSNRNIDNIQYKETDNNDDSIGESKNNNIN